MPLRDITLDDIESLAVGAWVLGTGGGGSPYLGLLNMRALYKEGHRVQLMPSDELADDDWIAAVSNMGAPLVGQERLTDSRTIARAVALMEEHTGHSFRGIMSLEIGGGNSIQPLMAAAHLKRPVIDSDMMGRAYPEAQMTSVAVGDLKPCPLTTVDVRGLESVVDKVPTWKWMERVSRKICVEYGSIASTCKAPRTGAEVKKWGIHGTTTKAIAIGHAVREAQRRHEDPIAAILGGRAGQGALQGQGGRRRAPRHRGLPARPHAVRRHGRLPGAALELNFQNEWIVAWLDGKPIAMSPDLICVLDSVSGEAVGTETIRYGQRVTVIALPPPPVFLSREGPAARRPARLRLRHRVQERVRVSVARALARRHRIAGRRRLGAGHRRRRQSLSAAAQHARALPRRPSRAAHGRGRPRRRRLGRHRRQHGRAAGRPGAADRQPDARACRLGDGDAISASASPR